MTHSLRSFNSPSNHVITKLNTVHCANLDELENFCRHVIAQRDSFTLTRSMQNQGIVKDRANFSAYCCSYTCGSKATKLQAQVYGYAHSCPERNACFNARPILAVESCAKYLILPVRGRYTFLNCSRTYRRMEHLNKPYRRQHETTYIN